MQKTANFNFNYEEIKQRTLNEKKQPLFKFSTEEKLQQLSNLTNPYQTSTVIAIYMELNKSKHSVAKYDQWIKNIAVSVSSPLALVINRQGYLKIANLRIGGITKYYVIDDIWVIMKQLEIERNKSYIQNYLEKQNNLDREKSIHNANLYAIWNLKCYIAYKIAQENPFNSKFFIYSDAGSFRERFVAHWPDTEFIENSLIRKLNDRILFGQIYTFDKFKSSKVLENSDFIQGGFFAGTAKALQDFYTNYFSIHDERLSKGLFIGKEQILMNLVSFVFFNQSVVRLHTRGLPCSFNYDPWFFFQVPD